MPIAMRDSTTISIPNLLDMETPPSVGAHGCTQWCMASYITVMGGSEMEPPMARVMRSHLFFDQRGFSTRGRMTLRSSCN